MQFVGSIAALAACASAHIIMQSPVPYSPAPDNSPLQPSGANFPCKMGSTLSVKNIAQASVGQTVKLAFTGTAVHNGGSCQVSLSRDGASSLNANSNFKVIYSILGGCPGLSGSTTSYDVPIPSEVPAGDYSLAWTWFNNIGNREMYMNCAPVTVSGGSGSSASFSLLPDMAVYNIATKNACKTEENFDVDFPNPGKYVLKAPTFKPKPPTCNGAAVPGGGSGSADSGLGFIGAAPTPAKSSTPSPAQTFNDGKYTPQASALPAIPTKQAPASAAALSPAPSSVNTGNSGSASNPKSPAPPANPPSTLGAVQTCPSDGALICSADGANFGLCNFGRVLFMSVAEGTKCVNGAISMKRKRGSVGKLFQA